MDRGVPWFLGVHKFAPSLTVWVDMGRIPEMVRLRNRLINVSEKWIKRVVFGFNHTWNSSRASEIHGVLEEVESQYGTCYLLEFAVQQKSNQKKVAFLIWRQNGWWIFCYNLKESFLWPLKLADTKTSRLVWIIWIRANEGWNMFFFLSRMSGLNYAFAPKSVLVFWWWQNGVDVKL